jgi:DNA-binding transcriptional MerR regulator
MASQAAPEQAVGYTVSAVARRLGVAAATLRTWDRRYGMSPSLRTAGSHRRYTEVDVALLQRMQSLMMAGMPPADAAAAAQSAPATQDVSAPDRTTGSPHGQPPDNVVPLTRADAQVKGLTRAANCMDTAAAAAAVRRSIARSGVTWTWDQVIAPVLRDVGLRYEQSGPLDAGIDIEHHLSHVVMRELIRSADVVDPVNPRPILLASAADEQHTLPLYAVAAALAERGVATRVLGARTPDHALAAAVRRTGPAAVFIWAQARAATDLAEAVPDIRPAAAVVVGGPGWQAADRPASVAYPQSLAEAVATLTAIVRPG